MNVLIVGSGKGSWEMRGQQLGAAIGARVLSAPVEADWKWADLAVLVKKAGERWAPLAKRFNVPVVWDAVDFWAQPFQNSLGEDAAKALLRATALRIGGAFLGSTNAMANVIQGGQFLPHHSWRGLEPQAPRKESGGLLVAYQGNAIYLGSWRPALERACAARGWRFAIADQSHDIGRELWRADILVAFRDGPWDGWMCRHWKSGVKIANAIAAGRPIITQTCAAAHEAYGPVTQVDDAETLESALDYWAAPTARQEAYEMCLPIAPTLRLPAIAERFRGILTAARQACPV